MSFLFSSDPRGPSRFLVPTQEKCREDARSHAVSGKVLVIERQNALDAVHSGFGLGVKLDLDGHRDASPSKGLTAFGPKWRRFG